MNFTFCVSNAHFCPSRGGRGEEEGSLREKQVIWSVSVRTLNWEFHSQTMTQASIQHLSFSASSFCKPWQNNACFKDLFLASDQKLLFSIMSSEAHWSREFQILQVKPGNHETWDNLPINIISRVVTVTSEKEENKSIYAGSCYFFSPHS